MKGFLRNIGFAYPTKGFGFTKGFNSGRGFQIGTNLNPVIPQEPTLTITEFATTDGALDYAMLPRIATNPTNGVVAQVYRLGSAHLGVDSKILMRRSYDNGVNWEYIGGGGISYIVESVLDVRNPGTFYTPSGRLIVIYGVYDGSSTWYQSEYIYSDNDGDTWSSPVTMPTGTSINALANADIQPYSNKGLVDASGYLYYPTYITNATFTGCDIYMARSIDNGTTWVWDYKKVFDGINTASYLPEITTCDLGNGIWVLVARCQKINADSDINPVIIISRDYGQNWGASGAETLTWADIGTDINSDFMYLEGDGVSMGASIVAADSSHPEATFATIDGTDCIVMPYYVRDGAGLWMTYRINIMPVADLLTNGFAASVKNISQTLFSSPDGAGNGSSIYINSTLMAVVGKQEGNGVTGSQYTQLIEANNAYVRDLLTTYNTYDPNKPSLTTLVGSYAFDEESGLVCNDAHTNDYDGTIGSGVTINQTGKIGKAYSYGGDINSNVQLPASDYTSALGANVTMCGWIKYGASPTGSEMIIDMYSGTTGSRWNSCFVFAASDGTLKFDGRFGNSTYRSSGASTTSIDDGSCHFFCGRKDGGSLEIWVNGVKESSLTGVGTGNVFIGDYAAFGKALDSGIAEGSFFFSGILDQVMIFNTALTTDQIGWLYNSGAGRTYSELQ